MSKKWAVNNTVTKNIQDLIEYDSNPREHAPEQIQQVAESIKEFGWTMPILIDETNEIIAGHGRLLAGKQLGIQKVPCIIAKGWSEKQKKAYCIADNKLTENSTWSKDLLKLNLTDLYDQEFDLELTGFSEDELSGLLPDLNIVDGLTDEDDVPEVSEEPITKLGNIWLCGEHRVMCGDSLEEDTYNLLMNNKTANISFTSPPYNADSLNIKGNERTDKKYNDFDDNMTTNEYDNFINTNLSYLLKYSEEVFYNIGLVQNNKKSIFTLINNFNDSFKDIIYWKKSNVAPHITKGVINNQVEFIITFGDGKRKFKNAQFSQGSYYNVIEGNSAQGNKLSKIHKATFPVYLPENIVKNFVARNALVLDCFGGTGTTLIACQKTNRICYMIELDNTYVDVIVKRWQNYTGKEAVLESDGTKFNDLLK